MQSPMRISSSACYAIVFSIVALPGLSCGPWDRSLKDGYKYRISEITRNSTNTADRDAKYSGFQIGGGEFSVNVYGTVYDLEPEILWITISCELLTAAQLYFEWNGIKVYEWDSRTAAKGDAIDFASDYLSKAKLDIVGNRSTTRLSFAVSIREMPVYFELPVRAATGESVLLGFLATPD